MKCLQMMLFMIFPLRYVGCVEEGIGSFFQFRKNTLENFNEARRLIAGGDFRKLYSLIEDFVPDNVFSPDLLGPASNMYQLKWSRELEQIGFEYMTDKSIDRSTSLTKTIEYKDHIGFYWMGNIFNLLDKLFGGFPMSKFKDVLKDLLDILEAFIIFVWLAYTSPKKLPLKEGQNYGPAEALFGERYEIGCFTELFYSTCFMKKLPYSEIMFKKGVPCTSCPTHCEFSEELDETIDEGELCVPPKEPQMNYVAANQTLTGASTANPITLAIIFPLILILIFCLRR